MNNNDSFKKQLKNLVSIYGDELFTDASRFYSLIVDSIKGCDVEKQVFKRIMKTSLLKTIYKNRKDFPYLEKEAKEIAKNENIKYESLLSFISDLLYSLGIEYEYKPLTNTSKTQTQVNQSAKNTTQNVVNTSNNPANPTSFNTNPTTNPTNQPTPTVTNNPQIMTDSDLLKMGDEAYNNRKYEEAFNYYKESYEKGNLLAGLKVGEMLLDGIGTQKDIEKGFKLIYKIAKAGLVEAFIALGDCYHYGKGTKTNFRKGFIWYKKAAKKGNRDGYFNLGIAYSRGFGVSRLNYRKAKKYFRKAADLGHPLALDELNRLIEEENQVGYDE